MAIKTALQKISGRKFFYPCAYLDFEEAIAAFADRIDEFVFADINFNKKTGLSKINEKLPEWALLDEKIVGQPDSPITRTRDGGNEFRNMNPSWFHQRYRRDDGKEIEVTRRRGFGQYALQEFKDRSIGVFMHRGDSRGESGSNTYFLANKRTTHPPLSNLFSKLAVKMADCAMIVSDGSLCHIRGINRDIRQVAQGIRRPFSFGGFRWSPVGGLAGGRRPTLIWLIERE